MRDVAMIDRVNELEQMLLAGPQVDLRTGNVLSGGMLARTIYIPAGTALTGATHKTDHVCVVIGDITVTTDEGAKRISGHHVFQVKAGSKRAGIAHEFTIWTTICKTDQTDLQAAEDELVVESERLLSRGPALPNVVVEKIGA